MGADDIQEVCNGRPFLHIHNITTFSLYDLCFEFKNTYNLLYPDRTVTVPCSKFQMIASVGICDGATGKEYSPQERPLTARAADQRLCHQWIFVRYLNRLYKCHGILIIQYI